MSEHIKSDISSYLAGMLPESRRREIEAHVAGCDSCRQAVSKARSKEARGKREALKKAAPDRLPNLLLNRMAKEAGVDKRPSRAPYFWGTIIILAGVGLWAARKYPRSHDLSSQAPESPVSVAVSSSVAVAAPAPAAAVAVSSGAAAAPEAAETAQVWHGTDSGIKGLREVVIQRRIDWRGLWDDMQQPGSAPRINFYAKLVVGVFAGPHSPGSRVKLGQPQEGPDNLIVPYRITGVAVSSSTADVQFPYALMTLPQTSKDVTLKQQP